MRADASPHLTVKSLGAPDVTEAQVSAVASLVRQYLTDPDVQKQSPDEIAADLGRNLGVDRQAPN